MAFQDHSQSGTARHGLVRLCPHMAAAHIRLAAAAAVFVVAAAALRAAAASAAVAVEAATAA